MLRGTLIRARGHGRTITSKKPSFVVARNLPGISRTTVANNFAHHLHENGSKKQKLGNKISANKAKTNKRNTAVTFATLAPAYTRASS